VKFLPNSGHIFHKLFSLFGSSFLTKPAATFCRIFVNTSPVPRPLSTHFSPVPHPVLHRHRHHDVCTLALKVSEYYPSSGMWWLYPGVEGKRVLPWAGMWWPRSCMHRRLLYFSCLSYGRQAHRGRQSESDRETQKPRSGFWVERSRVALTDDSNPERLRRFGFESSATSLRRPFEGYRGPFFDQTASKSEHRWSPNPYI